jgi:hypothetical protein
MFRNMVKHDVIKRLISYIEQHYAFCSIQKIEHTNEWHVTIDVNTDYLNFFFENDEVLLFGTTCLDSIFELIALYTNNNYSYNNIMILKSDSLEELIIKMDLIGI